MANSSWLDPNRPLRLLGHGLDAVMDKTPRRRWNPEPSPKARQRRYDDGLATFGVAENHDRRAVHGVELQDNLRAYGTTIDLRAVASAEMRMEQATRRGILSLRTYRDKWANRRG